MAHNGPTTASKSRGSVVDISGMSLVQEGHSAAWVRGLVGRSSRSYFDRVVPTMLAPRKTDAYYLRPHFPQHIHTEAPCVLARIRELFDR